MCFVDDLSVVVRSNMKMMEERIPTSYLEFGKKLINVAIKPYREQGVFPILRYDHLE